MANINYILIFILYGYFGCKYVCAPHICTTWRGQKKGSGPLELELQMGVSCHVRIEPRPSWRATNTLKPQSHLSSPNSTCLMYAIWWVNTYETYEYNEGYEHIYHLYEMPGVCLLFRFELYQSLGNGLVVPKHFYTS